MRRPAPEDRRHRDRHDEVRQVHEEGEVVPYVRMARRPEQPLEPDGRRGPVGQPLVDAKLRDLVHVAEDAVGCAAEEVVGVEEHDHRQEVDREPGERVRPPHDRDDQAGHHPDQHAIPRRREPPQAGREDERGRVQRQEGDPPPVPAPGRRLDVVADRHALPASHRTVVPRAMLGSGTVARHAGGCTHLVLMFHDQRCCCAEVGVRGPQARRSLRIAHRCDGGGSRGAAWSPPFGRLGAHRHRRRSPRRGTDRARAPPPAAGPGCGGGCDRGDDSRRGVDATADVERPVVVRDVRTHGGGARREPVRPRARGIPLRPVRAPREPPLDAPGVGLRSTLPRRRDRGSVGGGSVTALGAPLLPGLRRARAPDHAGRGLAHHSTSRGADLPGPQPGPGGHRRERRPQRRADRARAPDRGPARAATAAARGRSADRARRAHQAHRRTRLDRAPPVGVAPPAQAVRSGRRHDQRARARSGLSPRARRCITRPRRCRQDRHQRITVELARRPAAASRRVAERAEPAGAQRHADRVLLSRRRDGAPPRRDPRLAGGTRPATRSRRSASRSPPIPSPPSTPIPGTRRGPSRSSPPTG